MIFIYLDSVKQSWNIIILTITFLLIIISFSEKTEYFQKSDVKKVVV